MDDSSPIVLVVAGILRRGESILACRRRLGAAFGGRWELPGGKIRPRESPEEALVRELHEELGVQASPGAEVERIRHAYLGHPPVDIRFYEIEAFRDEPMNLCFESIRWLTAAELPGLAWLDADWPLVRRLSAAGATPLPPLMDRERSR